MVKKTRNTCRLKKGGRRKTRSNKKIGGVGWRVWIPNLETFDFKNFSYSISYRVTSITGRKIYEGNFDVPDDYNTSKDNNGKNVILTNKEIIEKIKTKMEMEMENLIQKKKTTDNDKTFVGLFREKKKN